MELRQSIRDQLGDRDTVLPPGSALRGPNAERRVSTNYQAEIWSADASDDLGANRLALRADASGFYTGPAAKLTVPVDLLRRSIWCGIRGTCAATDEWRTSVDFYLRGERVYSYPVEWRFGNTAANIIGVSFDAVADPTATVTGTDFPENSLYLDGYDGVSVFRWVIPRVRCLVQCDEIVWNWVAVNCQNQVAVNSSLFGVLACLSEEA